MDHTDIVARVKASLEARGVSLMGPDGAFEITKRVAWLLRTEGAGLLDKPGGNNSHGYATDIICYPSGHHFDILVSGGGEDDPANPGHPKPGTGNGPSWQDAGMVDPSRYRPAIDSVDEPAPAPQPPSPAPDAVSAKLEAMTALLASLDRKLEALARQSDANTEKIQQQIDQVVKNAEKSVAAILPMLGPILGKH